MKLLWTFIISLLVATTLSANCGKCDMKGMQKAPQEQMNCKMHKEKMQKKDCNKENCAKKQNCKMGMKKEGSCGNGKCGAAMNKNEMAGNAGEKMQGSCGAGKCGASMKKGSCGQGKCGGNMKMKKHCNMKKSEETKNCGCGMTVKDCKEMMSYCKFRDGEKKSK